MHSLQQSQRMSTRKRKLLNSSTKALSMRLAYEYQHCGQRKDSSTPFMAVPVHRRFRTTALLPLLIILFLLVENGLALSIVFMGVRRGKGGLERTLQGGSAKQTTTAPNQGRGSEIIGVSLPSDGALKGWEIGRNLRFVATNVDDQYYALQGTCPRCAFDLWKGDLITADDPGFAGNDPPLVACPTCSTTYSFRTGKFGPPYRRSGLRAFVGNLAQTATTGEAGVNAKAFIVTQDEEDGRIYMRER